MQSIIKTDKSKRYTFCFGGNKKLQLDRLHVMSTKSATSFFRWFLELSGTPNESLQDPFFQWFLIFSVIQIPTYARSQSWVMLLQFLYVKCSCQNKKCTFLDLSVLINYLSQFSSKKELCFAPIQTISDGVTTLHLRVFFYFHKHSLFLLTY